MRRAAGAPSRSPALSAVSSWLPVLVWAAVIAGASGDDLQASVTLARIERILRFFWPDVAMEVVYGANYAARKIAHLVEYAVFAALLVRAFASGSGPSPNRPIPVAVVVAALFALGDEAQQALSAVRSGSFLDCVFDSAGAYLGALGARALTLGRGTVRRSAPLRGQT